MTFNANIDNIQKKTKQSLGIRRDIKGIAKVSTKRLIELYRSFKSSAINYASCIWQIINSTSLDKLNKIQRHGLALCQ